jgi:glycosyltransferase involved in cell wall biosynthesis
VKQERLRFPDWESPAADFWMMADSEGPNSALLSETDLFVCPSQFVQQDLISRWSIAPDRTTVVPYIAPSYERPPREKCRKRILFVGTADLRKGIHYLARAATELRQRDPDFEVRVIGAASERVRSHGDSRDLHFMGTMSWREVQEEISAADVLVLPSLAEGSASVTYEALSLGNPQVVTASSGSVISSGVEGIVVPERDAEAVADAIELITKDRNRRSSMSDASLEKAKDYSFDEFKARLVGLLDRWSVAQ